MPRPFWEVFLTSSQAANLRIGGVSRDRAYNLAALVTRALDRAHNLGSKGQGLTIEDLGDDELRMAKAPAFDAVVKAFFGRVQASTPAGIRRYCRRLRQIAWYSLRSGGPTEALAAGALASAAREYDVQARAVLLEQGWPEAELEPWDGLGGLREELIAINPSRPEVGPAFDRMVADEVTITGCIRRFQHEAQILGFYTRSVDGKWGRGSEDAWLAMSGGTSPAAHRTTLAEVRRVQVASGGTLDDGEMTGAAIGRDLWLALGLVPESPYPLPDQDIRKPVEVSEVAKPESRLAETLWPSADRPRVEITRPPDRERVEVREVSDEPKDRRWIWIGLAGLAVAVGGVVWYRRSR